MEEPGERKGPHQKTIRGRCGVGWNQRIRLVAPATNLEPFYPWA